MAASDPKPHSLLSFDDYLELEKESSVRHEYVSGQLHALAGASEAHNRIALRVASKLLVAAGEGPCRVFMSDMKLRISEQQVYYPDVFVTCDPQDSNAYIKHNPCLVIEVLSPTTESVDRREKLVAYRSLPNVQAYVILFQDEMRAIRHWRDARGAWWHAEVSGDGIVTFPCPELEMTLAEIYAGIDLTG